MRCAVLTLDQRASRSAPDAVPLLLGELAAPPLPSAPALPFERTVGDEIQGVVVDGATGVEVVGRTLRLGSWNVGIGIGTVETPLPHSTRAGRGEAYLRAREAVSQAKHAPHRLTVVGDPADDGAQALETVLGLWAGLLERRSERGWEVYDVLATGVTHAQAARRLGISQSAVSQRAQAAGLVDEERARGLAVRLWDRLLGGTP